MSNASGARPADDQPSEQLHFLDYWRVIKARKEIILAVTLLVVVVTTAYTFTLPRIYMAETQIMVTEGYGSIGVFRPERVQGYNPFFLRTQFEIIQSRQLLYQVINSRNLRQMWGEKYNEDKSPISLEHAYTILRNSVKVRQIRDTSLIGIQVLREDPTEAARLADEIASVYRDQRLTLKRQEIRRAMQVLENEMQKQQKKVDEAEQELETLRKELGVTMLGTAIRPDKLQLQRLEADRISARVDMLTRKARLDQLTSLSNDELVNAAAFVVSDPALASVRQQLIDSEVSLKLMLQTYGVNHPDVQRLQTGVNELRARLQDALDGLKKGLQADYEVARARNEALEAELESARKSDIEAEKEKYLPFNRAERNLQLQRDILTALRARLAQEGIEKEIPTTPVDIIDPAQPPSRPISPNLVMNILLSLLIGLGVGVGLAYFIEYLDTSVKTVDDVERYLGLPVLGVIPQKVAPLVKEGPNSPHAEAYRILRTNLQFANKGLTGGAFAVVSGGVGEGKSTTLFNLAYVCAQMGNKVLVVDSDLRRPTQHTILGMSNQFGLTNVLMRDVPVEETIKTTQVPNLHFLPSGKLPRTSLGLLDTQRMRDLVKNLKARYDYVFFDSPPILGVTDASILASEVDGVLLVVEYRKYPRAMSLRARRMVDAVGGKIFGVVLNNINILRDDYYYYYHSYYSGYYYRPDGSKSDGDAADADTSTTEQKQDVF